ncbi:MAG: GSCFA domain-containing protein [Aquirufa sp.]
MKLMTSIPIPESPTKINHSDTILSIGSCFSENIGNLLEKLPINILNQPYGTLFHPNSIQRSLETTKIRKEELINQNGFFVHPDFHSQFTSSSAEKLKNELQDIQASTSSFIQKANWLIITWGTAFYYFDKNLQRPIANCHKQANSLFEKKLSSVQELKNENLSFFKKLKKLNPQLNIILTVSPVRHTKDGMMENSVSKSTLRLAADEICRELNFVHYFPAYEIMMDELRDYRYYGPDLIHPNETAIHIIWERFIATYFNEELLNIDKIWNNYLSSIHHRAHPEKQAIQNALLEKILDEIKTKYSHLTIEKTEEIIKSRILPIS